MWAATEKFTKRSTAKIMVKPSAGTASTAPTISPFTTSWRSFSVTSGGGGGLAALRWARGTFKSAPRQSCRPSPRGAELHLDDVAVVGELARPGGARILDLLAVGDRPSGRRARCRPSSRCRCSRSCGCCRGCRCRWRPCPWPSRGSRDWRGRRPGRCRCRAQSRFTSAFSFA